MAKVIFSLFSALIISAALAGCIEAKDQEDAGVEGVVLNFGDDYFFPRDGAKAMRIKLGAGGVPDGACVNVWAKIEQEEVLAPADLSNLTSDDHYVSESVLVIERSDVVGSIFDSDGPKACGFGRIERVQGVVTTASHETSHFRPRLGQEVWWRYGPYNLDVAFGPPVEPPSRTIPERHACIEAMAVVSPAGRFGGFGMSSKGLRIFEILWSAPHDSRSSDDCAFPSDPRP